MQVNSLNKFMEKSISYTKEQEDKVVPKMTKLLRPSLHKNMNLLTGGLRGYSQQVSLAKGGQIS